MLPLAEDVKDGKRQGNAEMAAIGMGVWQERWALVEDAVGPQ